MPRLGSSCVRPAVRQQVMCVGDVMDQTRQRRQHRQWYPAACFRGGDVVFSVRCVMLPRRCGRERSEVPVTDVYICVHVMKHQPTENIFVLSARCKDSKARTGGI